MIEPTELLRLYVSGMRDASGAVTASLYVPAPASGLTLPALIHEGEGDPVPELASPAAAATWVAEAVSRIPERLDTASPVILASAVPDAGLLPLPAVPGIAAEALQKPGFEAPERRVRTCEPPGAWLGLRSRPGTGPVEERLARPADLGGWWRWLTALGGAIAGHTVQVATVFRDPVTGLPGRASFQSELVEQVNRARRDSRTLSLLLINPDDFAGINERFGHGAGDGILREIGARIRSVLRRSDPLMRFGGAILAVILPGCAADESRTAGKKLLERMSDASYLDGAVRLGFSIGLAVFDPDDRDLQHPSDLVRRADQALSAAKRLGGGRLVGWDEETVVEEAGNFDRLTGIFTGNMTRDYRNMILLWDAVRAVSTNQDFEGMAGEVVGNLFRTLKADRVGLFLRDEDRELRLVDGRTRGGADETVEIGEPERELMAGACTRGKPTDGAETSYAVPLMSGDDCLGCLLIERGEGSLEYERSDLMFLTALGSQLAFALDRTRLVEREQSRQELQQRRLRAELYELRMAMQRARLIFHSPAMEKLLDRLRRVAGTDATVLIIGESGTGKELLARTIHELSPRRDKAYSVIDCGAIAPTLIESELFGHEKGAYTGAGERTQGRLLQAREGTVLLDEIGELPLEAQTRLLRFVQDKQLTPVGGSKPRDVDVRILAATNRDLAAEVRGGRFREDLYHRLNVVSLDVPPLRERPEDIPHLVRHFLEVFGAQFQRSVRRVTPDAEARLLEYAWPGNVRELENRMMQAVILCERDELAASDLGLPQEDTALARDLPARAVTAPVPTRTVWERLADALGHEIDSAVASGSVRPLGPWLADDLALEADRAADGISRRAAEILGIPETTYRRRIRRAAHAGEAPRSASWDGVRRILAELPGSPDAVDSCLLQRCEDVLLQEVATRLADDTRLGSSLLGVSPPTFRRRIARWTALSTHD